MATSGSFFMATSGDFLMTMDTHTRSPPPQVVFAYEGAAPSIRPMHSAN